MKLDGSSGSGNWGHGGRKGGGGSAPGGGIAFRITSDDGTYTSEAKKRAYERAVRAGKVPPPRLTDEEIGLIRKFTGMLAERYCHGNAGGNKNTAEVPGPESFSFQYNPEIPGWG